MALNLGQVLSQSGPTLGTQERIEYIRNNWIVVELEQR